MLFGGAATADNATLIARGGVAGGSGGLIQFASLSSGGDARVELFDEGTLDIQSAGSAVNVGSLEGNGLVLLGSNTLAIGSNNRPTKFFGIISGTNGSLEKIGRATLVLGGANTYTGTTTVRRGALLVNNRNGSGTGTGAVNVQGGTLGGNGTVAGTVTLGTGGVRVGTLSPGVKRAVGTLTIQSALSFGTQSNYDFDLNSNDIAADAVIANGVTINGGTFSPTANADGTLTVGTKFVVIDNTSAAAIAGAFANLPDGGTITIGNNTYQANYEGGDGNDLTLTVIP